MIKKHWIVIVLLAAVAWYVVHKNCPACQKRLADVKAKVF